MKSNLNILLEFFNLSQKDLIEGTGINKNTISRYCNNSFEKIDKTHVDLLCSFFMCTPSDIFQADNALVTYPSEMVKNMIESYKVMKKLSNEEKENIITNISVDSNIKSILTRDGNTNIISGDEVLENAKIFEKENGYNPIPNDDELFEIEQIQERLDLEYTLEDNLESIINFVISKSDLSSLPIRISKEIEAYIQQKTTSFQFKFILSYRSLYTLIVKQVNNKHLIDFISKIIKIYNNGGLYEINNDELETLIIESENLLDIYKKD